MFAPYSLVTGDVGVGAPTVTGAAGAETLNTETGIVTTEALATASGAAATRVLTNSKAKVGQQVGIAIVGGTNTSLPIFAVAQVSANGTVKVALLNFSGAALNGTVKYAYQLIG